MIVPISCRNPLDPCRTWLALVLSMFVVFSGASRLRGEAAAQSFNVPAADATMSLRLFTEQSGREIVYPADAVRGTRTNAIRGNFLPVDALRQMLAGTELVVTQAQSGLLAVARVLPESRSPEGSPPSSMKPKTLLSIVGAWLTLLTSPAAHAQTPANAGTIEGRVFSNLSNSYLANARVVVAGTQIETLTDAYGYFRLQSVPSGSTQIRVSYTGLPAVEQSVSVTAGQRAVVEVTLGAPDPNAPVKLDAFVVAASSEMTAAAIAVNEQRYTQTIKTVVSTDSFGDIADGNVGEFVKFLPGVSLGFTGGHASSISIGGIPPESTPITIDGNRMASAAGETRAIQLDQISINNMSRVEIVRSRNPDSPANAIGGSVNLIPKSAFERKTPVYTAKVYGVFRDLALEGHPYKILPNLELSATVPVNEKFGFSFNGTNSVTQSAQRTSRQFWVPTALAVSANLPATSPDLPYLGRYELSNAPKTTERKSAGLSTDWRIGGNDVLSLGVQYGYFNEILNSLPRDGQFFNPVRINDWGSDYTHGAAGQGFVQLNYPTRDITGTTFQPNLRWRHNGPTWNWEVGGAYSRSSYHDRDVDKGFWSSMTAFIRDLTLRFDEHGYVRPGVISVTNPAAQVVDYSKVNDYRLETVGSNQTDRFDFVRSFNANAKRDFHLGVPFSVKTGLDFGSQTRDIQSGGITYTFVGADQVARSFDDGLSQWIDPAFARRTPIYGQPRQEGISAFSVYDTYRRNPEYFTLTSANEVAAYRNRVNNSKRMTESIYASYVRFDFTSLLRGKLIATGGIRFERTEFKGVGPLINPSAIYERDAMGQIVRNTAGQPVIVAPLASIAGTQLAYMRRGAQTERSYGDFYPSINATYKINHNVLARVSYARSIARPEFNYILPSLNMPDETGASRTITLSNPDLEPWEADSYGVALEYYFDEQSAGLLSARGYVREIKNFWGAITSPVTPEILNTYGIDPTVYSAERGYVVNTRNNVGNAEVGGVEVDYRQNLTFLPQQFRGLSLFANVTMQQLSGNTTADFTSFVKKTINYGISVNRPRVTARLSVNERGLERRALFTGAGVEAGTYEYMAPRTTVDLFGEYRLSRHFAFYMTARNVLNAPEDLLRYGPSTPDYAKLRQRIGFRPLWSVGLKGTF